VPNYSSAALALLLASLAGCAAPLHLPDGVYTGAQGAGTLTVSGDRVEVRIPVKDASTPYEYGTYGYNLSKDGSVLFYGSSNSSYYLMVVIDYQWRWTGTGFESTSRRDGAIATFTPAQ